MRVGRGRAACLAAVLSVLVTATGCEIKKQSPPSLTGPSELGLSLTLVADPSVVTQDGFSWTRVTVTARDAASQPVADVVMRAEILIGGVLADFGQLSTRTVVTGRDGQASLIYTSPPPPLQAVDSFTIVTLLFTPFESNFANAVPRSLDIRLVPPGVLLPPNGTPTANFTVSSPREVGTDIRFDATSSVDTDGSIVSYRWDFGDGTANSGATVLHSYDRGGTFTVVLTVTDDRGLTATTAQQISVSATTNPSASFVLSPTNPALGDRVVFNASASTAATGRQIVSYAWTFGDGDSGSGVITDHTYRSVATFTVVLTVTDDLGRTGTSSRTVLVGTQARPTASFVFSPSTVDVGQPIVFEGGASTAPPPETIVTYAWSFGDGTIGSGRSVTHSYALSGTYNVVLQVTDSAGQQATASQTVTVGVTGQPTSSFVFSPTNPDVNQAILFDGTASTAPSPRTIVSWAWNFGDGTTGVGRTASNTYTTAGTYAVVLEVTDSGGQTAVSSNTVTVGLNPTAAFVVSPSPTASGVAVTFNAAQSTAPTGSTISSYAWNFGDGTAVQTVTTNSHTHTYAAAVPAASRTYTITLTVTDSSGRTATATQALVVD